MGDDMWFGSPGGPSVRHEGRFQSFTLEGLASQVVTEVTFRSVGDEVEAWIAHSAGVQRFDGENWEHFTPENSPLRVHDMRAVAVDVNGSLWIGSGVGNGGLYHYDGSNWEIYDASNSALRSGGAVEAIAVDAQTGTKWFVDRFDTGVVKFDGAQWTGYHSGSVSGPCPSTGIPPRFTNDVEVDTNGMPWIATPCGVTHFDGAVWTTFGAAAGMPGSSVRDIAISSDGTVWAATNQGVGRVDPTGSVTTFLPGKDVRTVEVAADGRVWVSVLNEFIAVYDGTHWIAYGSEHGLLDANILFASAAHPQGGVWFGGGTGIGIIESAPPRQPRDVDLSGDLDTADALQVARCIGGPGPLISPSCTPAERFNSDIDEDGHVDLRDFAAAQRDLAGTP
jgi:ligand-binding sensor domain-containing protein